MIGSGHIYVSMCVTTNSGRITAVRIAPQIAQNNQLGKFAPAILTIGSHPANSAAAASIEANLSLESKRGIMRSKFMRSRFYAPDCAKARWGIQCSAAHAPQSAAVRVPNRSASNRNWGAFYEYGF